MKGKYHTPWLLILLLLSSSPSSAQEKNTYETISSQYLYVNIAGQGCLLSVDYDRMNRFTERKAYSYKFGLGFQQEANFSLDGSSNKVSTYLAIPHHMTFLIGNERLLFETGVSGTLISNFSNTYYLPFAPIGFRIIPRNSSGFSMRGFFNLPLFDYGEGLILGQREDIMFTLIGFNLGIALH